MFFLWRPWEPSVRATNRTISVTGNATITATPDEYVFSPEYNFTDSNQQTALSELTAKSNTVVGQLKALGVPNKEIQTNSNGYGGTRLYVAPVPVVPDDSSSSSYILNLQITVNNVVLAQKVQNYLLTTNPTGQVSPEAQFSNGLQSSLQNEARQKAEQNARAQAEQSAGDLGFSIGAVKSVDDSNNDGFMPLAISSGVSSTDAAIPSVQSPQLKIQPGQNNLSYSVSVVYYIK